MNLNSKELDIKPLIASMSGSLGNQSKSLSPNSNGLGANNSLEGSPSQLQNNQAAGSLSSSPEKPLHYTYLKGFRVEQCALFVQHKCTNHKPFTCFDWHFQNQRRRRPIRRRDGTFNYSPDTYCTKYDETRGICPDKDDCPYLHKTAGDTERRYHLRHYKTGICVYETDSRGYCTKNGKHCAFAHGVRDLRNPVYDVREMQTPENGNSSGEIVTDASGLPASTSVTASIERERNALLEDPRWENTAYVLANYKTVLCKRPPRFCRQGYACPQYHNGKDRRRSPKIFKYRSTPCPNTKQGDEWVDPSKCEQGDQCPYCHSRTEQQFHPEIFKSTKCKDIQDTGFCPRGAFCAFAHDEEEILATRDIDLDNVETDNSWLNESQVNRVRQLSEEFQSSSLENQLSESLERMLPLNGNIDDDDDIFSSGLPERNDNLIFSLGVSITDQNNSALSSSTMSNNSATSYQTKNNLGPIARPRSYSHSQARSINTDFNQLHAALARARIIDEFKSRTYGLTNPNVNTSTNNGSNSNYVGFRERAVHSFSIASANDVGPSIFNTTPITALDFLPNSRLSNMNLNSKELDIKPLIASMSGSLGNQSKSLSPNSNGLGANNSLEGSPSQLQNNQAAGSLSSSPEKPLHYTYLKGFRVEQCALFVQHKCTNHKPFTCFDWHFQNQRRRRPIRRRDGTFNYSPDTYCTKYDETTGICPEKDDCQYLHKTAGDTERRYHLRYYKTGICVYETDSRGYCSKNGKHCAFAHGAQDLRNPVFDSRELQNFENGNSSGELTDTSGIATGTSGSAPLERERNALLEDPRWENTAYVLANYKTVLCKRPPRFCRQGYACPQYHNGKDRRRSPKIFKYRSTPCPNTKQGDEWVDPSKCEQGDQCPYCHSRTEQQFHPEIFKSTKCKDIQDTGFCPRGAFCAFAHNEEEILATRDIDLDNVETDNSWLSDNNVMRTQNEEFQSTLGHQLNNSIERMLPFNGLNDNDIFTSNEIRRMSDRNDNLIFNLGVSITDQGTTSAPSPDLLQGN